MRAQRIGRTTLLAIAAGAALTLAACREDEQGRILMFEKGEYLGEPDATLDADDVSDLRQRALEQRF